MQLPLEITYRDVKKTEAIERIIREKSAKLEKIYSNIISCRVAIERPQAHPETGRPYRVRLDIRVSPDHEIVVKKEPNQKLKMLIPLHTEIINAFKSAVRELEKIKEKLRGEVKVHPNEEVLAEVAKLYRRKGYGILKTLEGREVYFHRNSVIHDRFNRLKIGAGVWFTEEMGEKGPQATTVRIILKPDSLFTSIFVRPKK